MISFGRFAENFSDFWQNTIGNVAETAFYLSKGAFQECHWNKHNLKVVFGLSQELFRHLAKGIRQACRNCMLQSTETI